MLKKIILTSTLVITILSAEVISIGKWQTSNENNQSIVSLVKRGEKSFNLYFSKDKLFTDINLSVEFKANSGKIDQGGGLMWRVQDKENYYVARFNPLEDNFRFYLVHSGIRTELASTNIKVSPKWHKMRVTHIGAKFEGFIDGKKVLEAEDKKLLKAGGVGLWTKADALTSFRALDVNGTK